MRRPSKINNKSIKFNSCAWDKFARKSSNIIERKPSKIIQHRRKWRPKIVENRLTWHPRAAQEASRVPGVPCMQHAVRSGGSGEPRLPIFSTFRSRWRHWAPFWAKLRADGVPKSVQNPSKKRCKNQRRKSSEKAWKSHLKLTKGRCRNQRKTDTITEPHFLDFCKEYNVKTVFSHDAGWRKSVNNL